jgi:Tfp pilus assembly protein PilO
MPEIQQVNLRNLAQEFKPRWRDRPTFKEYFGMLMAIATLVVVSILILAFFAVWASTRPTLADAVAQAEVLQQPAAQLLRELQVEHFEQYRDAFQLFVLSGIVPLFTLIAGYAFGSARKKEELPEEE